MKKDIMLTDRFKRSMLSHMEKQGLNAKQLSERVSGPNGNVRLVSSILDQKFVRLDKAKLIAESLGVTLGEMLGEIPQSLSPNNISTKLIKELDVQAQGGGGMVVAEETIIGEWEMPREFLRQFVRTDTSNIVIISVVGDSMMPDYMPGQRVMVNTADTHPVPEGVFVVFIDGLMIKRCQVVPRSQPPMVKIISANDSYDTYEVELQDGMIKGRVVGSWSFS